MLFFVVYQIFIDVHKPDATHGDRVHSRLPVFGSRVCVSASCHLFSLATSTPQSPVANVVTATRSALLEPYGHSVLQFTVAEYRRGRSAHLRTATSCWQALAFDYLVSTGMMSKRVALSCVSSAMQWPFWLRTVGPPQ
jgi:hypothetical protein